MKVSNVKQVQKVLVLALAEARPSHAAGMRATVRFRGVRLVLLAAGLLAGALVAGASAATTATIGNTSSAGYFCAGGYVALNPTVGTGATSYVVPPGEWNITSWSTGASNGSIGLMVFRPTATTNTYTIVGESQVQTLGVTSGIKTFDLGTIADPLIPVQGGDILGTWFPGALDGCSFGSGASLLYQLFGSQPAVGASLSLAGSTTGLDLNISATLAPTLPTTTTDCLNGGWQTYSVFNNQGDCVSYIATKTKNQPATG